MTVLINDLSIFEQLLLSPANGRITSATDRVSDTAVIHIQDLPCHDEVQANISALLHTLEHCIPIAKLFVEGAFDQVDTSWLANISDVSIRETILSALLKSGRLTGAEHYSVVTQRPDLVFGADDEGLYKENGRRLSGLLEQTDEARGELNNLALTLDEGRRKYYTAENQKIGETDDTVSGCTSLLDYAADLDIPWVKYQNVKTFVDLSRIENNIDYERVNMELGDLFQAIKNVASYRFYSALVRATNLHSHFDPTAMVPFGKAYPDFISDYPALQGFLCARELDMSFNPLALVAEIGLLREELHLRLVVTDEARQYLQLCDIASRLADWLSGQTSSDNVDFGAIDRLRSLLHRFHGRTLSVKCQALLYEARAYYVGNWMRGAQFLVNCGAMSRSHAHALCSESECSDTPAAPLESAMKSSDRMATTRAILKRASRTVVLIAGGFHTQHLRGLLATSGISSVVITPNVTTGSASARSVFESRLREQARLKF